MRVVYHLAYPDASTRNDIFLIERFISALNNRKVQNHVRRRKPVTYAAAHVAANKETLFVLMDLATHFPGGVQAPTPGDTSFITAMKARRPCPNAGSTSATEKCRCYYCDREGHIYLYLNNSAFTLYLSSPRATAKRRIAALEEDAGASGGEDDPGARMIRGRG